MKSKIFIIAVFLVVSNFSFSQIEEIKAIKGYYYKLGAEIAKCSNTESGDNYCGYYSNEIIVNSRNNSWRAVGNYNKKITFWYDDQPDFAEVDDNSKSSVLKKVVVTEVSGYRKYYEEYIYKDDELIFVFIKEEYEETKEFRYYFHNGLLIRYMKGKEIKDNKVDYKAINNQSDKYIELFLATF